MKKARKLVLGRETFVAWKIESWTTTPGGFGSDICTLSCTCTGTTSVNVCTSTATYI